LPDKSHAMDMSSAANLLARRAGQKAGLSKRINDLPVMLAVLSAQQAAGVTAMRVREQDRSIAADDQPARLALIFAPEGARPITVRHVAGAFNKAVATRLSMGTDGEGSVYSGV
jgi:hypothetical protein